MTWIQTFTGRKFDLTNLSFNEIDIVDIAAGLSKVCRFAGQCPCFYSVAEHCVLGAYYILRQYPDHPNRDRLAMEFLLHDATEAYLGDISYPLKQLIGPEYKRMESELDKVIRSQLINSSYKIPSEDLEIISNLDTSMCVVERDYMMPTKHRWSDKYENAERVPIDLELWSPQVAFDQYLDIYASIRERI